MSWSRTVWLVAALLCGAGRLDAQAAWAGPGAHGPTAASVQPGPAPDAPPGPAAWSLAWRAPAPRPRLDTEHLATATGSTRRRGATRGLVIGAVVGGVAAGAFTFALREDTGRSPFQEAGLYQAVAAGAVAGGLIGGAIGLLFDR